MRYLLSLSLLLAACNAAEKDREIAALRAQLVTAENRVDAVERAQQKLTAAIAPAPNKDAGALAPKRWCLHPDSDGNCFHMEPLIPMHDEKYCMRVVHAPKCRVAQLRTVTSRGVPINQFIEVVPGEK